jgi:serine protease Do
MRKSIAWVALCGCAAGLSWVTAGWWGAPPRMVTSAAYAQQAAESAEARQELLASADRLSLAFRETARALRPSVVSIRSVRTAPAAMPPRWRGAPPMPGIPGFPDDMLERFFGRPFDGEAVPAPRQVEGAGSGVIISSDGYILTNNHVVEQSQELEVQLSDRRTLPAKVIGTDPKTDLALIRVEAEGLVAAELGDSDAMEVGDWVIAIGSPFGLTQTVTAGIVSAKNRQEVGITQYDDFLQTDAAINPGNSGGPLLNLRGEVIGINTAIASRSGAFAGVGFAIPSNMARRVSDAIRDSGRVSRGFIGVSLRELTPQLAAQLNLPPGTEGALVAEVAAGQPADLGGMQPGDVVVEVNANAVTSLDQLRRKVADLPVGNKAKFKVLRDGQPVAFELMIEEQTDERLMAMSGRPGGEVLGLVLENLTPETARNLGINPDIEGVLVSQVTPESPLAGQVEPGEVVVAVNRRRVRSVAEFSEAVAGASGGIMLQLVSARGQRLVIINR